MAGFRGRLAGALRLDAKTFEDVEHDASATSQAALVVLLSAAAGAIVSPNADASSAWPLLGTLALTLIVSLISWAVGAAVVWLLGTRLFPQAQTEADYGQLLRTVGFAQAPGLFNVLLVVPVVGWLVSLLVVVWGVVAMVIAVRQALDYTSTLRAVIVCLVAAIVMIAMTYPVAIWGHHVFAGAP